MDQENPVTENENSGRIPGDRPPLHPFDHVLMWLAPLEPVRIKDPAEGAKPYRLRISTAKAYGRVTSYMARIMPLAALVEMGRQYAEQTGTYWLYLLGYGLETILLIASAVLMVASYRAASHIAAGEWQSLRDDDEDE